MKKLYIFSFLFILSSINIFSQSGWFWQNPLPQGNRLNSIEILDNNVIITVGCGGTILRSTNQGMNWSNSNFNVNSNPRDFFSVFFINTNTGWVCGDSGTVMKTTNGGESWFFQMTNIFSKLNNIFAFDIYNIYACGDDGTVLISNNGGITWFLSGTFDTEYRFLKIHFVNENSGFICGYSGNGVIVFGALLYKTTNKGISWNVSSNFLAYELVTLDFINENTGFVGGTRKIQFPLSYYQILMKTTDSGNNWSNVNIPEIYATQIKKVKFKDINTGYLNIYNYSTSENIDQLLKTTDEGNSWQTVSNQTKILSTNGFKDFSFSNDMRFWGVAGYNIYSTNPHDTNWNLLTPNNFVDNDKIQFVNVNTGILSSYGKLSKTTNSGNNWTTIKNYPSSHSKFYFLNSNTGWLYNDTIFKTTNGGLSWYNQNIDNDIIDIFFTNQLTGYCRAFTYPLNNIYKSTNSGNNWSLLYSSEIGCQNFQFVDANIGFFTNPTNGGLTNDLYKTTNGGLNWLYTGSFGSGLNSMVLYFFDGQNGWLAKQDSIYSYQTIHNTTDGGITWTNQNLEHFKFFIIRELKFFNKDVGIAIANRESLSDDAFFLKTTNGGINWYFELTNVAHGIVSTSFINENTGWVCGSVGSILKTTTGGSVIGIQNISESIPELFFLHQNYPNPFNPVTKIKFDIPSVGQRHAFDTKILIYDLLGREITTLVNEQLKPGSYSVDWDGTGFASGVYFYSLITNDFTKTKRMVLIK